jgi:8-oxo-dGTP pyrophosphatase MutT (NUDIX family)
MLQSVDYRATIDRLRAALEGPLPGEAAQDRLAPRPRRQWPPAFDASRIRRAAGLLLVVPVDRGAHVVLTVRAGTLGRHRGQVSLPGGVLEPGETVEQAALREAEEEIGLPPGDVHTLGALTPLDITVSGFRLHPIVATASPCPVLRPADGEVAEILTVGVDVLLDPASLTEVERLRDGARLITPVFQAGGHEIWGATAMVLGEFLGLLGWRGPGS